MTAAYGLVNTNAKWQLQSDKVMTDHGLVQVTQIPQLFYLERAGTLKLLVAKIVDDLLITGTPDETKQFIKVFDSKYKFGSVISGRGHLRFFGLNILQNDDFSSTIDGNEKLEALQPVPLTRSGRRSGSEPMNAIEKTSYMSLSSSINCLGMTTSVFCSYYFSLLQQKITENTMSKLLLQSSVMKKLKNIHTVTIYPRPPANKNLEASVVVFADAGRLESHGQLCYMAGLLLGTLPVSYTHLTLPTIPLV